MSPPSLVPVKVSVIMQGDLRILLLVSPDPMHQAVLTEAAKLSQLQCTVSSDEHYATVVFWAKEYIQWNA